MSSIVQNAKEELLVILFPIPEKTFPFSLHQGNPYLQLQLC